MALISLPPCIRIINNITLARRNETDQVDSTNFSHIFGQIYLISAKVTPFLQSLASPASDY